jgi:hypothetical protein
MNQISPEIIKMSVAPPAVPADQRDLRLDFFRGLALIFIFLDHIPSNVMNWLTIRNFGFSDAAEAFVFMSGYSAVLAYSKRLDGDGFGFTLARIWKRCWQLYVAQMLLFMIYTVQIAYTATKFKNPAFSNESGIVTFFDAPLTTLIQAMLLNFRPANMDILPLYIVLLAVFPFILLGLRRRPRLVLILSVALYLAANLRNWNFAAWPTGEWVFNPLTWQLMFVLGALMGTSHLRGNWIERLKWPCAALAALYLAAALFIVMTWRFPVLENMLPRWLFPLIYPIDKTNLDPLRLLHFIALAYLVVLAVPANRKFLSSRFARPLVRCGQAPLEIFCLGIFLSFTGHILLVEVSGAVMTQVLVSIAGAAIMIGAAYYLSWYRKREKVATRNRAVHGPTPAHRAA